MSTSPLIEQADALLASNPKEAEKLYKAVLDQPAGALRLLW